MIGVHDRGRSHREGFVVVHTGLPSSMADAVERCTRTVSVGERAPIGWHAKDDLVSAKASDVGVDGLVSIEVSGSWVGGGGEEVCLMTGVGGPGTHEVVGHEADVI